MIIIICIIIVIRLTGIYHKQIVKLNILGNLNLKFLKFKIRKNVTFPALSKLIKLYRVIKQISLNTKPTFLVLK